MGGVLGFSNRITSQFSAFTAISLDKSIVPCQLQNYELCWQNYFDDYIESERMLKDYILSSCAP